MIKQSDLIFMILNLFKIIISQRNGNYLFIYNMNKITLSCYCDLTVIYFILGVSIILTVTPYLSYS